MTDDLGPGVEITQDLSTIFDAYRASAAGLASERQRDDLAGLLGGERRIEATFAEHPVTSEHGRTLASVDVTLHVPAEQAEDADDGTDQALAELLSEVVAADGYHVRTVRVVPG